MIGALLGVLGLDHWLQFDAPLRMGIATELTGLPLAVVAIVLAAMGMRELSRMASQSGPGVLPISGLLGIAAIGTVPLSYCDWPPAELLLMVLGMAVLGVFLEQMIRARTDDGLRRVACTLLAIMYLGVGAALILTIRVSWGVPMLLVFLAGVKGTDCGAYFTGKAFGRHKLIPWLSPGKTWEGLIGGMAVGAGLSMLAAWACGTGPTMLATWQVAVFGATVGLAGQFGDLCESLLKRSASVKDSGAVLPEFGGVLDILDSPLLAAPVALIVLKIMNA